MDGFLSVPGPSDIETKRRGEEGSTCNIKLVLTSHRFFTRLMEISVIYLSLPVMVPVRPSNSCHKLFVVAANVCQEGAAVSVSTAILRVGQCYISKQNKEETSLQVSAAPSHLQGQRRTLRDGQLIISGAVVCTCKLSVDILSRQIVHAEINETRVL